MKITPLDIQQQQFKGKLFGGLNPDEVDSFLQAVAQEMENLNRENNLFREQTQKMAAESEVLTLREKDLRETLLAAQRITEEMKCNAQKEAELIIAEAEVKAEKILAEAENKLVQLRNDIQELRRQKIQFESSFRSLIESHTKMLSIHEE
ncbi:MAG: DivIVA domain-containing protein [Deltaproteobacteria bacterium]|nr:DivIVA domain-containing protein [Deltaproteobacteria bacterium]TLN03545.1 MAG: DivIVA domain-containing protein [bacterium]